MTTQVEGKKVIERPDDRWLERLRRGHFVWLVKDQRYGQIEWAFEPPEPGYISGRLGIRRLGGEAFVPERWWVGGIENWFISSAGDGLDGKPLLMPVEGNCPAEMKPISEPWQRHVERTLDALSRRIRALEARVDY